MTEYGMSYLFPASLKREQVEKIMENVFKRDKNSFLKSTASSTTDSSGPSTHIVIGWSLWAHWAWYVEI